MNDFERMKTLVRQFTEDRDWDQFHNPKDLAIALSIEANELLEVFLWKDSKQASLEKVREELADVFNYAFLMADKYGFDVEELMTRKIETNAKKYPIEKARGTARKYSELVG